MACLRWINSENNNGQTSDYFLSDHQEMIIGRENDCQILLDSHRYGMVSRRHVLIRPVGLRQWEIFDLQSANGTYINGKRLIGSQLLQPGDQIILGQKGPVFIFDNSPAPLSHYLQTLEKERLTFTQLFPIFSTGHHLYHKAYLYPGIGTVIFVVSMFVAIGNPLWFNMLIATYLSIAAYYFVYQLCGKHKPWWVLFSSGLMTILILMSPILHLFIFIFRQILPGDLSLSEPINFFNLLIKMFFGAGLMEELLKALPIFLALILGMYCNQKWRNKIGICEPLDGILLGTASATGFTLLETLGQYVPNMIQNTTTLQGVQGTAELVGLQLLIPRILGSISGHIAYSGYFGYFIGLSVLRPQKKWLIIMVGYVSASLLHALWNSTGIFSVFLLALVGSLSYTFLGAAILKARTLSPNRAQNFSTRISS